jgi:hypothetical protein
MRDLGRARVKIVILVFVCRLSFFRTRCPFPHFFSEVLLCFLSFESVVAVARVAIEIVKTFLAALYKQEQ